MNDLLFLIECIKILGFNIGIRYFNIYRYAKQNPHYVDEIVFSLKKGYFTEKDPVIKEMMLDFAERLEQSNKAYHSL